MRGQCVLASDARQHASILNPEPLTLNPTVRHSLCVRVPTLTYVNFVVACMSRTLRERQTTFGAVWSRKREE